MSGFLDDREHAAENLFAHNEERLFLAHRAGVRDLGLWAANEMRLDPEQRDAYADKLVEALISGVRDDQILAIVQTDLERAGKPALSTTAGVVLAKAVALANGELSGHTVLRPVEHATAKAHPTHRIGASLSWRDQI